MRLLALASLKSLALIFISVSAFRWALLLMAEFTGTNDSLESFASLFNGATLGAIRADADRWALLWDGALRSAIVVTIAASWASIISVALGYRQSQQSYGRPTAAVSGLVTILSGVPTFVVALALVGFGIPESPLLKLALAGIVLGSTEGVLSEWSRFFRASFADLRQRTYFQATLARGQDTLPLAMRHIRPYFFRSLGTRVSYFLSGLIIIEVILEINGIGRLFFTYALDDSALSNGYCMAVISGSLIIVMAIITHWAASVRLAFLPDSAVHGS